MSSSRGGNQVIPRPAAARPGPPAPWSHLSPAERHLDVARVVAGLRAAGPARPNPFEPPAGTRRSAVLVPLFDEDGGAWVILTRRSQHLRSHRGEVSFPGGRQDGDETLVEAALREAREEIALDPSVVEVVGELDHLSTLSSNSSIVPVVGVLPARPSDLEPNPVEVESIVIVRLDELLQDDVHRTELWVWPPASAGDGERPMHFFELHGDTVWGATARMLMNLLCVSLGLPGEQRDEDRREEQAGQQ